MCEHMITAAKYFAIGRHGEQKRKGTNKPYYLHLRNVAALVEQFGGSEAMVAAAWLHDVIEDTPTRLEEIMKFFGSDVCGMVAELTDAYPPAEGMNRKERKERERLRLSEATGDAQVIKLADVIDNLEQSAALEPGFRRIYLEELQKLIIVLTEPPENMQDLACQKLGEAEGVI